MNENQENTLGRRSFLSTLGVLGAASLCPVSALAAEAPQVFAPLSILKTSPYLQFPSSDSMSVHWLTNIPCLSWVEYGDQADKLDKKAESVNYGLIDAYNTVHAICLKDLTPGHKYYYRICSKNIEKFDPYKISFGEQYTGEVNSFETPNPNSETTSFLVFNDIHDRPESFPVLMKYKGSDKKDFVFLNGDMFNYQEDEDQLVKHLLEPFNGYFSGVPFFLSRGNHETRGKFARHLPHYFNGDQHKFYFTFQQGPVYAIVLDSGEDKPDDTPVYGDMVAFDNYRLQQAEWLKKEIQKKEFKKAKYKIVFSHIPLYYSGDWHGTMHCREVWGPILNEAKIDMLISGHTHKYGIHPPVKNEHNYPIVIGGGPKDGFRTIIKVQADQTAFKLDMIDDSGKTVGNIQV